MKIKRLFWAGHYSTDEVVIDLDDGSSIVLHPGDDVVREEWGELRILGDHAKTESELASHLKRLIRRLRGEDKDDADSD